MYNGYIYIIKNKINNKVYIGKTKRSVEIRWKQHINSINRKSMQNIHLYRAMNKYGVDKFYVETLKHITSNSEENLTKKLNVLEKRYIKKYDSFKNGYNSTLGGDGGFGRIISEEERKKLSELKIGKPHSKEHVKKSALGHKGLKMSKETKAKIKSAHVTPILQYSLDGTFIKEWESIKSATDTIGLKSTSSIQQCLSGKSKQSGGYVWKYKLQSAPKQKSQKRPVQQYTINDEFVAEFESAADAARNVIDATDNGIIRCCKNKQITSGGYRWKYKI